MGNKPKVAVIMSTYNGEKYLNEQIDSILSQEKVDVYLHVFDDCSKDSTVEIVNEYTKKHKNVILHINEKNKNYTYNFIDGLFTFKDNQEFDYYAFSDQDDVWMPNKLIAAIEKIKEVGKCTLYCSNLSVVDADLHDLGRNVRDKNFKYHHYEQMLYCTTTGCTAVFDKAFKDLVTSRYPENLVYHDYWVGLVANYCKKANYYLDASSYILYRQHGKNASGGALGKHSLKNILKFILFGVKQNFHILRLLLKYFAEELDEKDKMYIEKFIEYKRCSNKRFLMKNLKCNYPKKVRFKLLFNRFKAKKLEEM